MKRNYKQALEYIFSRLPAFTRIGPAALRYDLGNITMFCEELGNPQNTFPSIHIAGTNGKGTVSHILASIFQEAGYKTGLHTSPHYKDFRERTRINGRYISKAYLRDFINENYKLIETIQPSYFEMSVALAFSYFASEKVDIAIVETGLGGRLDSTNIITPLLSVITNISMDHSNVLGESLELIASEKAGIIKSMTPVLIGEKQVETKHVFDKKASSLSSPIYYSDDILKISTLNYTIEKSTLTIKTEDSQEIQFTSNFSGPFTLSNIKYSIAAAEIFRKFYSKRYKIDHDHIINGVKKLKRNTRYFGRWNIIGKEPYVISDGAHNKDALKKTFDHISGFNFGVLHVIFGIVGDKSWLDTFEIMPKAAKYYFTQAQIPRAMKSHELKDLAGQYNLNGEAYSDVHKALQAAKECASSRDLILITGSIYLVGEL